MRRDKAAHNLTIMGELDDGFEEAIGNCATMIRATSRANRQNNRLSSDRGVARDTR
jgi:hypothetical protein